MITIVMQSYLGDYPNAAAYRCDKFVRAIHSVLDNTYQNWELQVVSDGCEKTKELIKQFNDNRIKFTMLEKNKIWSGIPRNIGISKAKYNYICYLDTDDVFGTDHLQMLVDNFKEYDWIWFNDMRYCREKGAFIEHNCRIEINYCGTSTIAHKKGLATWKGDGKYGHDWDLISDLKDVSNNYAKIPTPSYFICHVPGLFDV